jgi:hypothetical protein
MIRWVVPFFAMALVACSSGADPNVVRSGGPGMRSITIPLCGDRIDAVVGRPGPLIMTGTFPSRVDHGGDGMFAGTVTVTHIGPRVSGTTSREAYVFVTRDGKVVSTPLPQDLIAEPFDLDSDAGKRFDAPGTIRSCATGAGELLPAGRYHVFAMVVVNQHDGAAVMAAGGPWPLEVA